MQSLIMKLFQFVVNEIIDFYFLGNKDKERILLFYDSIREKKSYHFLCFEVVGVEIVRMKSGAKEWHVDTWTVEEVRVGLTWRPSRRR